MLNLSQHIEQLLLNNDCVVIPGFGGIIAHHIPAIWDSKEKCFLPPGRTVGFNPLLKINDGLLGQSYMESFGVSYPEAIDIIDQDVKRLNEILHREGLIELANIGCIRYSANNTFSFEPYRDALVSPSYYGLDSFEIKELEELLKQETIKPVKKDRRLINPFVGRILRNAAAVAIVFVVFLYNSTPIENTHIDEENYAHILPADLFNRIKKESLITTPIGSPQAYKQVEIVAANSDTIRKKVDQPVSAKEVKVVQPAKDKVADDKKTTVADTDYKYHLIIASVTKESDGTSMVEKLHAKGFEGARVISGDGRIRVSISSYTTREEATRELFQLREMEAYKNAWLLTR